MNKMKKGFTLIELLVVIAIIGILSAVVLAQLNGARAKSGDTAVKEALSGLRTQAQLYYEDNSQAYGTAVAVCDTASTMFTDTAVKAIIDNAVSNGGTGGAKCVSTGTAYGVAVPLKSAGLGHWCVDSTGKAIATTNPAPVSTAGACQ
ncbi:MAG: type II secretion system protein [Candidatus Vogelbacteria bacterium]|nr:type II secretion system protein [Candidatus Vogelbacteria bacterium]